MCYNFSDEKPKESLMNSTQTTQDMIQKSTWSLPWCSSIQVVPRSRNFRAKISRCNPITKHKTPVSYQVMLEVSSPYQRKWTESPLNQTTTSQIKPSKVDYIILMPPPEIPLNFSASTAIFPVASWLKLKHSNYKKVNTKQNIDRCMFHYINSI